MDSLYLPFLVQDENLSNAMNLMNQYDSRAIVIDHYEDLRLYMNRDVVNAIAENGNTCADLQRNKGQLLARFYYEPLDVERLSSLYFYDFLEKSLDAQGVQYGIPFPPSQKISLVLVVTRHETLRYDLESAVKVCICPDNHTYECPPVAETDQCEVDGKPLKCC